MLSNCNRTQMLSLIIKLTSLRIKDIAAWTKPISTLSSSKIHFVFEDTSYNLRGHSLKLKHEDIYGSRNCWKFFFSVRVVNIWNDLPDSVVSAPTIITFKSRLEKIDLTKYMKFDISRWRKLLQNSCGGMSVCKRAPLFPCPNDKIKIHSFTQTFCKYYHNYKTQNNNYQPTITNCDVAIMANVFI